MRETTKLIPPTILLGVAIILLVIAPTFAAEPWQQTHSVDRREARQRRRIKHGIHSGSVTQHEAAQISRQQKRIRSHEKHAKADGKVTARERRSLQRQETRASRNIYRKKHNNRTR